MSDFSLSQLMISMFTGPWYFKAISFGLLVGLFFWFKIGYRIQNDVTIEKVGIYHVKVDENIYQIGILVDFYNFSNRPIEIYDFYLNDAVIDLAARGTYLYRGHKSNKESIEISSGNILNPNSKSTVKALFPLKTHMVLEHKITPELVVFGKWHINTSTINYLIKPKKYGNYETPLSEEEWDNILTDNQKHILRAVSYKSGHKYYDMNDKSQVFLLYNLDRSSKLDLYGYDQTVQVKNSIGIMVFVIGKGKPPLEDGWMILGNSYTEVWSNKQKLKIYNSIYPPGENGPRPFGVFVGFNKQMGATESVATTRPRGIKRFFIGKTSKDGQFTNMFY